MKVMKLNNSAQNVNAMYIARTINKTKALPSNINKDFANRILKNKSTKLTAATLVGIAGIVSSFALLTSSIEAPNMLKDIGGAVLLASSSAFSIVKSFKNKVVQKAYDILNSGKNSVK